MQFYPEVYLSLHEILEVVQRAQIFSKAKDKEVPIELWKSSRECRPGVVITTDRTFI